MGNDFQLTILLVAIGSIFSILLAFIWIAVKLGPKGRGRGVSNGGGNELFDEDYREKLRARGVARFERSLDENSAVLQKELSKVSEEVTDYIKQNISDILNTQLDDQKQTVKAAEERMAQSFRNVDNALNDYQKTMATEMKQEVQKEVQRRIDYFDTNTTEVVGHYIKQTLADKLDINDQIPLIIASLEENKTAIIEDLKREV